jgi:hypothetical protein
LLCNSTVTLLWKCNKLIVTQQELLRYYGNTIGCIRHATKETPNMPHYVSIIGSELWLSSHLCSEGKISRPEEKSERYENTAVRWKFCVIIKRCNAFNYDFIISFSSTELGLFIKQFQSTGRKVIYRIISVVKKRKVLQADFD